MDISTKNTVLGVFLSALFAVIISGVSSYYLVNINQAVFSEKIATLEAYTNNKLASDIEINNALETLDRNAAVRDEILRTVVESVRELSENSKKLTSMVDRIDERMKLQERFQSRERG